jgi:4-hydroxy-tetrahydrodipicolinate synthase
MIKSLSGLTVPVITPMNEDLSIDYIALKNHLSRLMNKGVRNFFILSNFSEYNFLSEKSKKEFIRNAKAIVSNNSNILIGCFGSSTDEIISNVNFAEKHSDYTVINLPYDALTNEISFIDFFDKLFRKTNSKIILCNSPLAFKRNIPINGLGKIAGWERLVGIVDESNNMSYFNALCDYSQSVNILQGVEEKSLESFNNRCFGIVVPLANVFPEIFLNLKKDFIQVGYTKMVRQELNILNLLDSFPKGKKVQSYKYILSLMGIAQRFFSPFLNELTEEEELKLNNLFNSIKAK